MSELAPDQPAGREGQVDDALDASEVLSALAAAPDFAAASSLLLTHLLHVAGGTRAAILLHDAGRDELITAARLGWDDASTVGPISILDVGHPLVAATLAMHAVACPGEGLPGPDLPDGPWLAIPLPRPAALRGVEPIASAQAASLLDTRDVELVGEPAPRHPWFAVGPGGIVLLAGESVQHPPPPGPLRTVALAGPMLARMWETDRLAKIAMRAEGERGRLMTIVNSLPDPIVITDPDNDILVQNARAEHLLDIRENDSEGRRRAVEINNLLFTSFLAKAVIGGGTFGDSRELNLVDPDEGADLLFEVLARPLAGELNPHGTYLSVLRDVTDLRRAGRELEQQIQRVRLAEFEATGERDRLNLILENVADPIIVTDENSDIVLMNETAEQLFQPGAGEHGAQPSRAAAVRNNDAKFTSFISEFALRPDASMRVQMTLTDPASGLDLPVEVVSGKIRDERGEPVAIVSALHDLTEQVENEHLYRELQKFSAELEERVRAATENLEAQNAQLQWQSRELEKASRLKSEFLASMSHELRTPINAVIGYTSLMIDKVFGEHTEQQMDGLQRIRAAARHLQTLIDDILDLSKIEAGKMPLYIEEVEIPLLVTEIVQQLEPMVRKKALAFHHEVDAIDPRISTDRTRLKQVLLNLLSNAVKFTQQGSVSLKVQGTPAGITIEIRDTGIGIRPDDLASIWDDFRQVDQSRTREFGGTGLGLSITRKLLERLGGQVEVASEYGRGTTFVVRLPFEIPRGPDDVMILEGAAANDRIGTRRVPS